MKNVKASYIQNMGCGGMDKRVAGWVDLIITTEGSGASTVEPAQPTHGEIITSLLQHNDAATSFRRDDYAVIASCVRCEEVFTM